MDKPIKLMFTITDLIYGGGQTVIAKLLPHFDQEKFSPIVVSLTSADTDLAQQLRQQGVPVYDLKMNKRWPIPALWRYFRLLKKEKPSIIHSSLFHANIASRLVGRLANVPILVSWRQNIELGGQLREKINRLTIGIDDKVVAVCKPAKQAEISRSKVDPDKVIVIPNCVDVDLVRPPGINSRNRVREGLGIGDSEKMLLTIGRLHPQKGINYLLDSLSSMLQLSTHGIRLVIVGEGELEEKLKRQTQEQGLAEHVIFTGRRQDIPELLTAADLFVLASLWEGLPLVVLEAMAAELPIVATDVGGTAEAIIDGTSGLLVPPANSEKLAEKILTLLNDESLGQTLARNGLVKVKEEFSASSVAERFENLYLKLLTDKSLR
jgi:glycosyltransferase involved in cell wall biosynthesis